MVRGQLRNFVNLTLVLRVELPMFLRVAAVVCACALSAGSAVAEELGPDQARAFVVGKLFSYTCFDGTAGMGRIFADGSVVGTIRPAGRGEVRFASLPARHDPRRRRRDVRTPGGHAAAAVFQGAEDRLP